VPTYVRHQEIAHTIGPGGRLDIRLTDADVRLRAVEGGDVRLRATFELTATSDQEADGIFEAASLDVHQGDDSLEIRDRRDEASNLKGALRRLFTGESHSTLTLEGEVPPDVDLRLETVSGDVAAEGLRAGQRYRTVSGDLYVTDTAGDVRLNTVSGDATIRADASLLLRGESVSGDLSIIAARLDGLRLSTVSGDLEVEGELDRSGDHRIETVSGDLSVGLVGSATFDVRGLSSDVSADMPHRIEGRADRRRVVVGDGRPSVIFSSMSGDVHVRRPRRLAEAPIEGGRQPAAPEASEEERAAAEGASLDVLRALERGEIDVEEAARRLGEARDA
jgi:Putative adhesin